MGVNTCLWSELEHKQWPGKVAAKHINAKFFACELWVKRVSTLGVVLYRNQWPVNFILHFTVLHIGSSIRYKNTLFWNYFLNCYIVKRILISFQLFFWVYDSLSTWSISMDRKCMVIKGLHCNTYVQLSKLFVSEIGIIFLPVSLIMCCWCSFEYPQDMFWFRSKNFFSRGDYML